jgi:hypothetical protein
MLMLFPPCLPIAFQGSDGIHVEHLKIGRLFFFLQANVRERLFYMSSGVGHLGAASFGGLVCGLKPFRVPAVVPWAKTYVVSPMSLIPPDILYYIDFPRFHGVECVEPVNAANALPNSKWRIFFRVAHPKALTKADKKGRSRYTAYPRAK